MLTRYVRYIKLVWRKPLLVFRIVNNYFKIYILKREVLRKVDICLTLDCVCDCDKCSCAKMKNYNEDYLRPEEIKELVKQCLALGAIQLNLTGGEPLLRKDIFKIISLLQPSKSFISINTTGMLLDKQLIEKLKLAGVDMIKMSLDSPIASEHDRYRNTNGSYRKVLANLKVIKQMGAIRSHISTVTIPKNIRTNRLQRLVKVARMFNSTLALTIPCSVGRWTDNDTVLINNEDRQILNELIKKNSFVTEDIHAGYTRIKCPAGTESLYITCYGDVIPCSVMQISFGNIRNEKLKIIYQKMRNLPGLKEAVPICKVGESKVFINRYLKPISTIEHFPVSISEHPAFKKYFNK